MAVPVERAARYDAVEVALAAGVSSCTLDFTAVDNRDELVDEARTYFNETYARSVGFGVAGGDVWLLTIFGG